MNGGFRVTESWIREFQSREGGWTRDQQESLGLAWPPREGWIRRVVGMQISDERRTRFERRWRASAVRRNLTQDMFA